MRPHLVTGVTRREVLKTSTILLGSALLAPGLLTSCARESRESVAGKGANPDEVLLEDIADTILPTTAASPGAKAAGVGATMLLILNDCLETDVQQRVAKGLQAFRATCRKAGGEFGALRQPERERMVRELDAAAQTDKEHWFAAVRELALNAYFSSEIGLTRAMRYSITPGRYDACVPLEPGQPAWG
jgi:hypothetical protein